MSVGPMPGPIMDPEDGVVVDDAASLKETVSKLLSMASVSVMGYSLLGNPVGFVLAAPLSILMDLLLGLAGEAGHAFTVIAEQLSGAIVGTGAAGAAPFASVGELIMGMLLSADHNLTVLAGTLGMPAPFVVIVFWIVVTWAVVTFGWTVLSGIRGVVPWI